MKKGGSKSNLKAAASSGQLSEAENAAANGLAAALEEFQLNDRSTTGVLTSHPQSRDIQFESFSLLYHGHELLADTNLELNYGRCVPRNAARLPCRAAAAVSAMQGTWGGLRHPRTAPQQLRGMPGDACGARDAAPASPQPAAAPGGGCPARPRAQPSPPPPAAHVAPTPPTPPCRAAGSTA